MNRNINKKGVSPELLKRVLIYGALFILLAAAESSFFSKLKPFGATPDLILGAIIAITMFDSSRAAAVSGIAAGFIIDAIGATGFSFSTVFYLILAVSVGAISEKMLRSFLTYVVLLIPALFTRGIYTYLSFAVFYGSFPERSVILGTILPELLSTAIFVLPIFFIVKIIVRPIGTKGKFSF